MEFPNHHLINGEWRKGGGEHFTEHDPANGEVLWQGNAANAEDVDAAVSAANNAYEGWDALGQEGRERYLYRFRDLLKKNKPNFAETISRSTGKPLWESLTEVNGMIGKIDLSVKAINERRSTKYDEQADGFVGTAYKPHGAVAVIGPFNLPGHLPNAHIVPALLAGNTVVFKPSEQATSAGHHLALLWQECGLPKGVLNVVQGGRATGEALTNNTAIGGLFFTGGYQTGLAIHKAFASRPQDVLALELGGNTPLVVWDVSNLQAAAYWTIQSAFITAGQRCTCTRRLIVPDNEQGQHFLDVLVQQTKRIRVGFWNDNPEPFMGPLISAQSAQNLLAKQKNLLRAGAKILLKSDYVGKSKTTVSPGLTDVTAVANREDSELFGPLLQIIRVSDFEAALAEANNTAFGLAAGLISDRRKLFDEFRRKIKAGIVNWNCATTGASGTLPFGGVGISGNHRPSGYFAADFCSYPVATVAKSILSVPSSTPPGIGSADARG